MTSSICSRTASSTSIGIENPSVELCSVPTSASISSVRGVSAPCSVAARAESFQCSAGDPTQTSATAGSPTRWISSGEILRVWRWSPALQRILW